MIFWTCEQIGGHVNLTWSHGHVEIFPYFYPWNTHQILQRSVPWITICYVDCTHPVAKHSCDDIMIMMISDIILFFFFGAGQRFQPHGCTSGGFRVGGGVYDSYTFQCGLVGSFTSPGIDTR